MSADVRRLLRPSDAASRAHKRIHTKWSITIAIPAKNDAAKIAPKVGSCVMAA
jgi:hypothetical protein